MFNVVAMFSQGSSKGVRPLVTADDLSLSLSVASGGENPVRIESVWIKKFLTESINIPTPPSLFPQRLTRVCVQTRRTARVSQSPSMCVHLTASEAYGIMS